MRVRQERPNLTRMTRLGFVNAYLVAEDDGLTLVDTMLSGSADRILSCGRRRSAPDRARRPHPCPQRPRRLPRRARGAPARRRDRGLGA